MRGLDSRSDHEQEGTQSAIPTGKPRPTIRTRAVLGMIVVTVFLLTGGGLFWYGWQSGPMYQQKLDEIEYQHAAVQYALSEIDPFDSRVPDLSNTSLQLIEKKLEAADSLGTAEAFCAIGLWIAFGALLCAMAIIIGVLQRRRRCLQGGADIAERGTIVL